MDKLKNSSQKKTQVKESRLEHTEISDVVPDLAINETAPQSDKKASSGESGGTISSGEHTMESTEVKQDELATTLAMENKTKQRKVRRKEM